MKLVLMIIAVLAVIGGVTIMQNQPLPEEQSNIEPQSENEVLETSTETEATEVEPTRSLDLSNRGLTQVPMSTFDRTEVEVLDLSGNNLSGALQAEIRHLKNLRVLNLSDNNFTGVPAEVGQLSELEILNLSNNPITGLPYEIGNLKNLKLLDLRGTNYAEADLRIIRQTLPSSIEIKTD